MATCPSCPDCYYKTKSGSGSCGCAPIPCPPTCGECEICDGCGGCESYCDGDCCGGLCCPAGQVCCGWGCCPEGTTCCGYGCCPEGTSCCDDSFCCSDDSQECIGGQCCSKCNSDNCEERGEGCECESSCDPAECETCMDGSCEVCEGDDNKTCCGTGCCRTQGERSCQTCINGMCYIDESKCQDCQYCGSEGICLDECIDCQECVEDHCISCGSLNKVCCDGWCEEPCEEEDDESMCSSVHNTQCPTCVGIVGDCSVYPVYIYTNAVTYDCSGGCFGDCDDVQGPVCYRVYKCKNSVTYNLAECTSMSETGPVPLNCYPVTEVWQCTTCAVDYDELWVEQYAPSKRCQ